MEWSFLHPSLWPLLLTAAVPLLVHLISRRRAREVRFGPMEFVLRSQRRSARRIQLRQWLLMAA
ncbi:MAG: BatA domain-containing protein, partial [Deltaproteobacteria bacterium]|nr:BatA domain-containing protein [Deltaproteobacteria bacterium]